jgi:hypothetical protein
MDGEKQTIFIAGAGPVGLMTAYLFLRNHHPVIIAENRDFTRKQIIRLEVQFWNALPPEVKAKLKFDGACQFESLLICNNPLEVKDEIMPGGADISVVIGAFQWHMNNYLVEKYGPKYAFLKSKVSLDEIMTNFKDHIVIVADGGGPDSLINNLWVRTTGYIPGDEANGPFEFLHLGSAAVYTIESSISNEALLAPSPSSIRSKSGPALAMIRALPHYFNFGSQIRDSTRTALESVPENKQFEVFSTFPEGKFINDVISRLGIGTNLTSFKSSFFSLDLRTAKQFYYSYGGKSFFIIGDAAFNQHFFTGRGMNNGFISSKYLVNLVTTQPPSTWCAFYNMQIMKLRDASWSIIPNWIYNVEQAYKTCQAESERDLVECIFKTSLVAKSDTDKFILSKVYKTIN